MIGVLIEKEITTPDQCPLSLNALTNGCNQKSSREPVMNLRDGAVQEAVVQQCWRVSPGPDFVLVVHTRDMPGYLALSQRLFTGDANVRNVKAFFATRRAKFETKVPVALD